MQTSYPNRRKNRSDNVHEALHHQLKASANRAKLLAMVLSDHEGFVFSATESGYFSEQVAAIAPLLVEQEDGWQGTVDTVKGVMRLAVSPIEVNGRQLFLTACYSDADPLVALEMVTSGLGVGRILA